MTRAALTVLGAALTAVAVAWVTVRRVERAIDDAAGSDDPDLLPRHTGRTP